MSTNEIIKNFIINDMLQQKSGIQLGDDDQLVESGIIDSMGVMNMLGFLEERFNIQIPGDELMPENFATVSAIVALVERQRLPS